VLSGFVVHVTADCRVVLIFRFLTQHYAAVLLTVSPYGRSKQNRRKPRIGVNVNRNWGIEIFSSKHQNVRVEQICRNIRTRTAICGRPHILPALGRHLRLFNAEWKPSTYESSISQ